MLFLADESCDFAVVRALRAVGHDVMAVAELAGGAGDPAVANLAVRGKRILLTEDKDFGQLVYATGQAHVGVILIRFPPHARGGVGSAITSAVHDFGARLAGTFAVVEPGRVRLGRSPHG